MYKQMILLLVSILLSACGAAPENSPTLESVATPAKSVEAACSSPTDWKIDYHRTGGIAGSDQSLTLQSDGSLSIKSERPPVDKKMTLPADHLETIKQLLVKTCPFEIPQPNGPCADCYNYGLEIKMDTSFYSIQATDVTLTEELRPLTEALDKLIKAATQ